MQKSSSEFSDGDRDVVRRWRLLAIGFYGSILALLLLVGAYSQSHDVNYASAQSTRPASPGNVGHQ